MVKMDWQQDKSVKNWFEQLKSKKTIQNYKERFPKFLEFVNQTPTQIIVSRLNHLVTKDLNTRRYWETMLIKFTRHLESLVDSEGKRKLTKSSIKGIQTRGRARTNSTSNLNHFPFFYCLSIHTFTHEKL